MPYDPSKVGFKFCKFCKTTKSLKWWKCCPNHTTDQGPDVVCQSCAEERHNVPSPLLGQTEYWDKVLKNNDN
jgi:hypothetical protein